MSWINNLFRKKAFNLKGRQYNDLICSNCGSNHIVKNDRTCGAVQGCEKPECKGCHYYQSNINVHQSFKCLSCGATWSIVSPL